MSAPNDPQTSEMFFWWALGLDRDDIAKVTGISKNMVNKKLSPGEDYIANLLEDCNSDSILNYIEYLGLDRQFNKELLLNAADKLDIPLEKEMKQQGKKEILKYLLDKLDKREQCISMNPTNMHLRYIIWSIMSASAHHENIEYSLDNLLYRTVNYKGSILAGDAFTTFFERRHRLKQNNIIISFDNDRSWESLKDSKNYENLRRYYVWKICYAMGWSRFMSGIENKKQIWNGTNLRLDDIRYIDRDDRENAELTLYTRPASYVAHLGTNYGILQDPGLACKFASKSFRQSFAGDMKDLLDKARKAMNAYDIADTENIVEFLKQEWPEDIETNLCEIIDHFLELERKKLRKLDNNENERSIMANLLSVNTTYITQDKYVIIQKRGKNCGHGGDYRFQTSAAGFVALPVDLNDNSGFRTPSIEHAIMTETFQEMGKNEKNILSYSITGIVRDATNLEVGIMAKGLIDATADHEEILGLIEYDDNPLPISPAIEDNVEVEGFYALRFTPRDVFRFIIKHSSDRKNVFEPWNDFMPLGAASLIFALANEYGWEMLKKEWFNCMKMYSKTEITKQE